ncbi:MAG: hypothetical protein Q7S22_04715 [Candidatus Micrarchaeota archaeon]|nr:hypothetical protein [Candidatus Micrarchaeota archaeon]
MEIIKSKVVSTVRLTQVLIVCSVLLALFLSYGQIDEEGILYTILFVIIIYLAIRFYTNFWFIPSQIKSLSKISKLAEITTDGILVMTYLDLHPKIRPFKDAEYALKRVEYNHLTMNFLYTVSIKLRENNYLFVFKYNNEQAANELIKILSNNGVKIEIDMNSQDVWKN